jgi:hypothetical protein
MHRFKHAVLGTVTAAAIACAPIATAGANGFGHVHPWGLGRGLLGAVFGLATLPLAIASAALSATEPEAPPYQSSPAYDGRRGYAPPPPYYAAPQTYYASPQTYYAPPRAYYPRAPVYSPAPRAYYAPRTYYAPRPGYYGGPTAYRAGGYAYPRR